MVLDSETLADIERLLAGEDRHAGVAGFFGTAPEVMVAAQFEWQLDLFRAGLGFLQAEDVRLFGSHEIAEALAEHRTQAIHVP